MQLSIIIISYYLNTIRLLDLSPWLGLGLIEISSLTHTHNTKVHNGGNIKKLYKLTIHHTY
jgi:hypothetical protein